MINYLSFSDSAKYADIARNLASGLGYGNTFSFWSLSVFESIKDKIFPSFSTPPVMPLSIAAFFKVFGVTDFAVIATSFFYFILALIFIFLLGNKIFKSKLVGILSTLAVGFNLDIINYATNGASESPFIFEIVAASYFATLKKRWATVLTFLLLVLMYFTRPQAFIYIAGIVLYWLLVNFKFKKAILCFSGIAISGLLVDYFFLVPLLGNNFLYSIIGRAVYSSFSQSSAASGALRGAEVPVGGMIRALKNIFYNLYNFYKLLPQIISPYLFTLFVIGLFLKVKYGPRSLFNIATVFMVLVTFLVAATSIPFFRYLHPIIPLVYIVAVATIVEILKSQIANYKQIIIGKLQISKQTLLVLGSCILVFIFGVGQTLGVLLLDSRFEAKIHNGGKPPVYVQLSKILKENTKSTDVVVTNLDTWGSWYGERKTVWFPVEPKQLIDPATGEIPFDAIYLTSYLIDDANYYMGEGWRMIFDNPTDSKMWTCDECDEIAKEYELKSTHIVSADDDYEKQGASALLLIKK